ncbi:MAG: trehalase family glycosidase, partial [Melioribacteraceae bacterium]
LSGSKDKNSDEIFYSYGPSIDLSNNKIIDSLELSKSIEIIKQNLTNKLIPQLRNKDANHPARDMVWKNVDKKNPIENTKNEKENLVIPTRQNGTALIYDMGEIQLGRFFIEGNFPDGTIIDIGFSEELNSNGLPWLYKRYQIGAGHRFITSEKQKRYETFKPYGAKYIQINILKNKIPVSISKAGMVRQVYPFEQVGSFKCSDTLLNRIWGAGWRTLQLCAEDSYTDTPFRERGLYAGDMLPEAVITTAVTGDTRLLAHSLRVFQDMYNDEMQIGKENVHSEFPLITLLTLDYVTQYSNDWSLVKEFYSNYKSLLKNHLTKKMNNNLIKAEHVFLEWTDINRDNSAMTAFQAITVRSLNILASWAKHLNNFEDEKSFSLEANKLREAINKNLWDKNNGSYYDGIKNDTLINKYHLTSSIWPVLFGVADANKTSKVLKMLKEELKNIKIGPRVNKITPYSSFYLFAILYQLGEVELAEKFMKEHWGPMALHSDKPTVWENFDIAGEQGTSSHAWSGHPTYFLSSEVLGVNLGFHKKLNPNVIEIEPQSETVDWAEGTVVHPAGKVFVSWKIVGNKLKLNYDAPKNTKVIVRPKGRLAKLKLVLNNNG